MTKCNTEKTTLKNLPKILGVIGILGVIIIVGLSIKIGRKVRNDWLIERWLGSKRLELQKYFVFNLGKEVKEDGYPWSRDSSLRARNAKFLRPSLARDLTNLCNEEKELIYFFAKDNLSEWEGEKLNHRIANGQQTYIVFNKEQINEESCSWIKKQIVFWADGTADGIAFEKRFVLDSNDEPYEPPIPIHRDNFIIPFVEAHPHVCIFLNKKETWEFLKKNDPALKDYI